MSLYSHLLDDIDGETDQFFTNVVMRNPIDSLSSMDKFHLLNVIGEGTYGKVYKAEEKQTKNIYAVKQLKTIGNAESFPISSIREMMIMKQLNHVNIANVVEICYRHKYVMKTYDCEFFLVFPFYKQDLMRVINNHAFSMTSNQKKFIMQQTLDGLEYIHKMGFLHRDIKPENILLDSNGTVKFIDFGLSRSVKYQVGDKRPCYTSQMVTLWYRPPEILLGSYNYDLSIDIWSLGCVFVELWTGTPLFRGQNEIDQLNQIFRICGSVTKQNWPEGWPMLIQMNVQMKKYSNIFHNNLHLLLKHQPMENLLCNMLVLDPNKRHDAKILGENEIFKLNYFPQRLKL